MTLAIVTATTNVERARPCLESWLRNAIEPPVLFLILNGEGERPSGQQGIHLDHQPIIWSHTPRYLGTVPAFRKMIDFVLTRPQFDVIACLHDDFEIQESGWDAKVLKYFSRRSEIGLIGFGGATGLGDDDLYEKPYDPMSLARNGFRSDLVDAEAHGIRSLLAERVACLDGFSQIGSRTFWEGYTRSVDDVDPKGRPWTVLEDLGFVHHFYDGALGCLAARYGWETWYVPLRGKHWGGQTAVGDRGYQAWAETQVPGGDHGFWEKAHQLGYQAFRDVLPLRV